MAGQQAANLHVGLNSFNFEHNLGLVSFLLLRCKPLTDELSKLTVGTFEVAHPSLAVTLAELSLSFTDLSWLSESVDSPALMLMP